jgi:hypothetical protein
MSTFSPIGIGPPEKGKENGAPLRAPSQTAGTSTTNSYHKGSCRQARPLSSPILANKTRPVKKGSLKNAHSCEPLKTEFTLKGFNYRQIAREENWAVYEQRWRDSENVCYEVVRIRREEATTFPSGRSYPAREVYPPSEAWGTDGFTLTDKDAAFKKLKQLSPEGPVKTNLERIWEHIPDRNQTGTGIQTETGET